MPLGNQQRAQDKLRRLLTLLNALAAVDRPLPIEGIMELFDHDNCSRTIRRDLQLLSSMRLVVIDKQAGIGWQYQLNRPRSERLVGVAQAMEV